MLYNHPVNYNDIIGAYKLDDSRDLPELAAISRYFKIWSRAVEALGAG